MAETALRVLAWIYLVGHAIGIVMAPYLVDYEPKPYTPRRLVVSTLVNIGRVAVLWDYLR